ncbi:MAG: alpha/beta fold hydrolase [Anaeromyxobacter sp.]
MPDRTLTLPTGATLAVSERGAGPPVVLLHGWSLPGGMLGDLAGALAPSHRVLLPDLRGHGGSAPGTPFGLADLAADLAALLEALGVSGVTLAGWSLGGLVALEALRDPRVRARVDQLALIAATPCFTQRDGWPHGVPARAVEVIAHRVRREPARACARFLADALSPAERAAPAAAAAEAARAALPATDPAAALAGLEILASADLRPHLAALDLPALVLHGDADPITPFGAGQFLAAALPRATLRAVPGAGHLPFLTAPGLVTGPLRAFLGDQA